MYSRNKNLLHPVFREQLVNLETELRVRELHFFLFMGLRTFEEQDALYAQGRTTEGNIVTNARGGYSWHNYGLAADYVLDLQPDKPGIQWSWETKVDQNADGRKDWMQLGQCAKFVGLQWGGDWKRFPDLPHVQNHFNLTLAEARELYAQGDIPAVWDACT